MTISRPRPWFLVWRPALACISAWAESPPPERHRSAPGSVSVVFVGDVMLDRYWFGEVSRISPEAPVPIVKVDRIEDRPGGAANVARNAAALGAKTALLSVVGRDEPGRSLQQLLRREKVATSLHIDATIATTVKLRVIGRQQQLLRADFETLPFYIICTVDGKYGSKLKISHFDVVGGHGE